MTLIVHCPSPTSLLAAIKKAIDDGHIKTWAYDRDGDFTHTPPQWKLEAWFRPKTRDGVLQLGLLGKRGIAMSKPLYGVYHGRFAEELLTHFDSIISELNATPQKVAGVDDFV